MTPKRRSVRAPRGLLAGLALLLVFPGIPAGTNPRILQNDRAAEADPSDLPEIGIASFGRGAKRPDDRIAVRSESPIQAEASGGVSGQALTGANVKISGAPMAGNVDAFAVSPDGARAVFIADKDTLNRPELYSVPVDGSAAPTKISTGLVFGTGDQGVSAFEISPDSASVVFLADPTSGGGIDDVYSAPIDGSSAAVRLNGAGSAPVTGIGMTPDGNRAIFFGVDTSFGSGAVELYSAVIGTASSAVQISDVGQGNPLGDVVAARLSPDSSRVVYAGDGSADNVFQWYSVAVGAAGPGSEVQLSAALGSVSLVRISPNSGRAVYTGDDTTSGVVEVFSVPIAGGARIKLNPSMAGDGAIAIQISPDGNSVGYLADQNTSGVAEVYSAQMLVAGSGIRLNTPMAGAQFADTLNISPDSSTVVYEADQTTPGTPDLYRVFVNGFGGPTPLHSMTPPASAGFFQGLGTPIIGRRVVYPVFGATIDIYSVPFDGGVPPTKINHTLPSGQTLFNVFLPSSATRLMAYGFGPSAGTATRSIYAAPIRGDLPGEQVNVTAVSAAMGVLGYEITSDERYAVYLQDQSTSGKPELYSTEIDSDTDTVVNADDNCPFIANPSQGPVVFPVDVLAVSTTTFFWGPEMNVRFVRGPLDSVDFLATNASGTLFDAIGLNDAEIPPVGTGFYYLFAPDCAGRSYQTVAGAEPARDLAGFP